MLNLKDKKVIVSGASSMIGRGIIDALYEQGALVLPLLHADCNLLDYQQTYSFLAHAGEPDYVIHAAGWNGGIEWNRKYPATIYQRTAMMALNIYLAAAQIGVSKIVGLMASCSYPDMPTPAYKEETLWDGKPNSTVECHGLAKRIIADFGRQISKQYNSRCISVILNNCYGPHDSFHLDKTKVVGALIRKFVEAKQQGIPTVICWGTGCPLREFIFAPDAGQAIVECLMAYDDVNLPINITSNEEITIKNLTLKIAEIVGYTGSIVWDINKPDGQMRKSISGSKFRSISNMQFTPLSEGLKRTIDWYIQNKDTADNKGF